MLKVVVISVDNFWDCDYYLRCQNNKQCLLCGPEQRLLSLYEDDKRKQHRAKAKNHAVTKENDNSGQTLEEYVAANFNNLPTVKEWNARRQAGSGNIWFMPGDVADSVVLAECKERGTTTSKGEKSISIPKSMLEKIDEEAKTYNTYPALCFRFKNDSSEKTYVINDFNVLVEMVHEIKILRHENKIITNERDVYKKASQELYKEVQRLKKKGGET